MLQNDHVVSSDHIWKRDIKAQRSREMSSAKEAVVPSDLFPHVYDFLVECNLTKAAKSLKKECKAVSSGEIIVYCAMLCTSYHDIINDSTCSLSKLKRVLD